MCPQPACALTVVLAKIEANGFRLDTGALDGLSKELDHQLAAILEGITSLFGAFPDHPDHETEDE